jgi:hypothetical protein
VRRKSPEEKEGAGSRREKKEKEERKRKKKKKEGRITRLHNPTRLARQLLRRSSR